MKVITKDNVVYIATLAKVAITDQEAEVFTAELDAILGYVKQLEAVDVTDLEPTYQVTGLTNQWRDDIVQDYGVSQDALLQNARASHEQQLKVPRVL